MEIKKLQTLAIISYIYATLTTFLYVMNRKGGKDRVRPCVTHITERSWFIT
jgi:hypothetical protein